MNLIPAIDLIEGQCVRLFKGRFDEQTVYDKDPVSLAREYQAMGFSNLHIVDLDGARSGQQQNEDVIRSIVLDSTLNVQVGGGEVLQDSWLPASVSLPVRPRSSIDPTKHGVA